MKVCYCIFALLLVVLAEVSGQRRATSTSKPETDVSQSSAIRGRGRSRFTTTSDFAHMESAKTLAEAPRSDPTSRRLVSRKRVSEKTERLARPAEKSFRNYEVEETVNESPIDSFKRQSKPRVLTETHFEATNSPKKKLLETNSEIKGAPKDLFKPANALTLPETALDAIETTQNLAEELDTTFRANTMEQSSSEIPKSEEFTGDITKNILEVSSLKSVPTESRRQPQNGAGARRINHFRTRGNAAVEESTTASSRSRVRTRATRRPDNAISTTTASRIASRGFRRRGESTTLTVESSPAKKGPSVFGAEENEDISRLRTGRKIGSGTERSLSPEKISIDLTTIKIRTNARRTDTLGPVIAPRSKDDLKKTRSRFSSRAADSAGSSSTKVRSRSRATPNNIVESTTILSRGRYRSRDLPPVIDEQKLEVLPLFERESKTVGPVIRSRSRSRSKAKTVNNVDDTIITSATDNDLNFAKPNEIPSTVTTTVSKSESFKVETRTQSSVRRALITRKPQVKESRKPQVKESIVAEVNEVTSKRTINRRKNDGGKENFISANYKVDKPKVTVSQVITSSRGIRKTNLNLADLKSKGSSEEIDDSDNYPEHFKALLHSKQGKKVSRTQSSRRYSEVPTITTIVTSSSTEPTTIIAQTEAAKETDDENELVPKVQSTTSKPSFVRPTRKRFSLTTKFPEPTTTGSSKKANFSTQKFKKSSRSTLAPISTTSTPREHRFHAKFSSTSSVRSETSSGKTRSFSSYPRGLYSSRSNSKEDKSKDPARERSNRKYEELAVISTQIPKTANKKKSNRYSAKYRSDISSKSTTLRGTVLRSTTNAPAYIPTIPTAAYVPTVPSMLPFSSTVYSDGTEDIDSGFEQNFNNLQSANLVKEVFSTRHPLLHSASLVTEASTEKPTSIIERIINSITAINTTTQPDAHKTSTYSTTESSSAILKLAPKKTRLDKTDFDQTYSVYTTEKPTTIIEKILSSLSAIQATDDTNSIQVGNDFNTISSNPTTPLPRVTKSSTSSTTLLAQESTSINPLQLLDEISDDQVIQRRTIGKLLELLNGLITTTESPQNLVVVTPKISSFVSNVNSNTASTTEENNVISTISTTDSTKTSLSFTIDSVDSSTILSTIPDFLTETIFPMSLTKIQGSSPIPIPLSLSSSATLSPSEVSTQDSSSTQFPITASTQSQTVIDTATPSATTQAITQATIIGSIDAGMTTIPVDITTTTNTLSTTEAGVAMDSDTLTTYISTIPTLQNFEVSPESVLVFSSNDLSNEVTPDDNSFSTVTIASRFNFDGTATTESTTTESSTTDNFTAISATTSSKILGSTSNVANIENQTISVIKGTTTNESTDSTTILNESIDNSTLQTSTVESTTITSTMNNIISSVSNQTDPNSTSVLLSNRSGRLLNIAEEPVQNNIDVSTPSTTTSTTPDYFVFAVLNNNTILRKRPPTIPNKDTPFVIVGLFPNNTVVRKFPNGTLVPMEQIIRVEQNTISTSDANPLSLGAVNSSTVENKVENTTLIAFPTSSTPVPPNSQTSTSTLTSTITNILETSTSPIFTTINNMVTESSDRSDVVTTRGVIDGATMESTKASVVTTTVTTPVSTLTTTLNPVPTTTLGNTATTRVPSPTLPTLSELLNGRTLEAFNSIINTSNVNTNSDTNTNFQTLQVNEVSKDSTQYTENTVTVQSTDKSTINTSIQINPSFVTTADTAQMELFTSPSITYAPILNSNLKNTAPSTTTTSTTTLPTTTGVLMSFTTATTRNPTTIRITQTPVNVPSPAPTFFPTFLTTLFPNLLQTSTWPSTTKAASPEIVSFSATSSSPTTVIAPRRGRINFSDTITTDNNPVTITTTEVLTSTMPPTTLRTTRVPITTTTPTTTLRTTRVPTTTARLTNTAISSGTIVTVPVVTTTTATTSTKPAKLKQLTEEQKQNLETLAQLEKEQAALLKQLSFLTSLNFGGTRGVTGQPSNPSSDSLANRIIALAMERDKTTPTTKASMTASTAIIATTTKLPASIQDQLTAIGNNRQAKKVTSNLEEVLKQYNLDGIEIATTPRAASTYGKSSDAILASILKEQGIEPSTPKSLADQIKQSGIFSETTTRRPKPRTTTQRPPGRLMQGLNWLLSAFAPQPLPPTTTRKPNKLRKPSVEQELLSNSPTHITPVVTAAPKSNPSINSLSQNDIQKLIKQLESIQKDPKGGSLDFGQIKNLQNLINTNEAVEVMTNGQNGATSRSITQTPVVTKNDRALKSSTALPSTVTNEVLSLEEEIGTTAKPKPLLPPLRLRPVPGVDDGNSDPFIRGNLITAAVNVTRAISGFLGTALQGAAHSFQNLLGSGSRLVSNYSQGSPWNTR